MKKAITLKTNVRAGISWNGGVGDPWGALAKKSSAKRVSTDFDWDGGVGGVLKFTP